MKIIKFRKKIFNLLLCFLLLSIQAFGLTEEEKNTIDIFKKAADSTVYITNVRRQSVFSFEGVSTMEVPRGSGSGFLWDKKGHIVTNFHVIQGGEFYYVTLRNKKRFKAKLVGAEPKKDLAVIKLEEKAFKENLKPLLIGDSESLQVGQKTLAIGNPYGLDYTLTTGIVSALDRQIKGVAGVMIHDVIQTDASINPGNSGGPLLDSNGALIGMNTAIYSRSGSSAGIGFAVPVSFIKKLVPQIIKHGKVIQPGFGISIWNHPMARKVKGVVIRAVESGSAASKAGLKGMTQNRYGEWQLGDVIISIDGKKVSSYDELYHVLDDYKVGNKVRVKILRGNQLVEVTVRLQVL